MVLSSTQAASVPTQEDERLVSVLERISRTTPEGSRILDKVQEMKPEVSEIESTKTLMDMVQDYAFNKGAYNINIIGWSSSRKSALPGEALGRWSIVLHYKDFQKKHQSAEWEYNEETNKLCAFEKENAPDFWSNEQPEPKKRKK